MANEKLETFDIAVEDSIRLKSILRDQRAPVAVNGQQGAWWLRRMVTTPRPDASCAVVLYAVKA